MSEKKAISVPPSTVDVLAPSHETVDSAENHGCVLEAQPVVDAGKGATNGHWAGNGQNVVWVPEG